MAVSKKNNVCTELFAINKLEDALLRTGQVDVTGINRGSTQPSWDGQIILYNEAGPFNKKGINMPIPVQVKGTMVERFNKESASFQADVADLNNYLNDGGVMFFLVQLKDADTYRIYYASLLPFDLRKYINEAGTQTTKSIRLEEFPYKNEDGMRRILEDYCMNQRKQAIPLPGVNSMQDLRKQKIRFDGIEFSTSMIGYQNEDELFQDMLKRPQYVYVRPEGIDVPFVVDKLQLDEIIHHGNAPVVVDGEELFDHIDKVNSASEGTFFRLENDVIIKQTATGINFSYQYKGTLHEIIKETKLMLALQEGGEIYVGGQPLIQDFKTNESEEITIEAQKRLKYLLQVDETLKRLHVKKDLEYGTLKDIELKNLHWLVKGILDRKPVPLHCPTGGNVGKLVIGNITVLLSLKKNPDGQGAFINDFFAESEITLGFEGDTPADRKKACPYVLINADWLTNLDNIDKDLIAPAVKGIPFSYLYGARVSYLCLELLKYFDKEKVPSVLDTVIELLAYLQKNDPKNNRVHTLNRLQTEKRRRTLTRDEKVGLMDIKTSTDDLMHKLAANILLESFQEAQIVYDQMDEAGQKEFDGYPIANLWPNHLERT